jgi:hypothetical protein
VQSEVERRCFIYHDKATDELCVICIHVDDSFIWCSDSSLWERFFAAWSARFPPSQEGLKGALAAIEAEAKELEYCGLTLTILDDGTRLTVSAGKLVLDLQAKIAGYPVANEAFTPMKSSALQELREPPTVGDPLLGDGVLLEAAMSIVGLGGWIVQACRVDATLPFIAFAQQMSVNFKRSTWAKILRWAKYIIDTAEENVLTFSAPLEVGAWRASSDSSCINALDEEGLLGPSFAAWTIHFEGSAPFDHGCMVLRGLGQATAHSELRAMAYVAKIAIALRMLAREMGFAPEGPTILLGDSKAALEGSLLDKTKRQERFLAAQKGMLRLWVRSKVFRFVRVPGYALRPDINTKSNFTREEFERLAHWVQSGVPRGDDKQLTDAEMTLQGVLAEPARVSVVRVADHHVSWEHPFPEHWPNLFADGDAKSSGGGSGSGHRGDGGPEAQELVLQQRIVRKQKKQLRAAAGDAQRLMAVIEQEKSLVVAAEARAAERIQDAEDAAARQVAKAVEEVRAARHVARTLTGQLKAVHRKA